MNFNNCHNINSFRQLAKQKLPSPIFNYIDGAADDEVTYSRNTKSFEDADLIKEKELLQRLQVNLEPCLEFLL